MEFPTRHFFFSNKVNPKQNFTIRLSRFFSARCAVRPQNSVSVSSLEGRRGWLETSQESDPVRNDYDAILVLGGGLLADGSVPAWVSRRLDAAEYLYHIQNQQELLTHTTALHSPQNGSNNTNEYNNNNGTNDESTIVDPGVMKTERRCPILLLGAGTPHKVPVLGAAGHVLHESSSYASYLLARGVVPPRDLLKETSSYDTVGNAYFSVSMHVVPAGWRRLAVVTSAFHMPRTRAIFDSTYEMFARDFLPSSEKFKLSYHPVSDDGLFDPGVVEARIAKEAKAAATWRQNVEEMASVAELHAWLFATHLCYSVSRQHEFGQKTDIDPRLAATY